MAQTLGILDVIWNGTKIPIEKGGTVKLGGLASKEVKNGQQTDYSNEYESSEIDVTTRVQRGQSILNIWTGTTGELQVLCDTGQTYVWPDAFASERPSFTGGDGGKLKIKWIAGVPQELLNG